MTGLYRRGEGGHLELIDEPEGQWTTAPEFASGAGGWISTAADLLTFHRMLLSAGRGHPAGRARRRDDRRSAHPRRSERRTRPS